MSLYCKTGCDLCSYKQHVWGKKMTKKNVNDKIISRAWSKTIVTCYIK